MAGATLVATICWPRGGDRSAACTYRGHLEVQLPLQRGLKVQRHGCTSQRNDYSRVRSGTLSYSSEPASRNRFAGDVADRVFTRPYYPLVRRFCVFLRWGRHPRLRGKAHAKGGCNGNYSPPPLIYSKTCN